MKNPVFDTIKNTIKTNGYLRVSEFINITLLDKDYGYYTNRDPFGREGDFITSPEISQMFGEMIGIWLIDSWFKLGSRKISLIELGAGRGLLMHDLLNSTKHIKDFHENLSIYILEASDKLKNIQRENLSKFNCQITWIQNLDDLPKSQSFFIANEFLDALPMDQYYKENGKWFEVVIKLKSEDELYFNSNEVSEKVSGSLNEIYPNIADKNIVEISKESQKIIGEIAGIIKDVGGAGLFIDYGYYLNHNNMKNSNSTLQAVKKHKYADILSDLGWNDITYHVDFYALEKELIKQNISNIKIETQRDFLISCGINYRAEMLIKNAKDEKQRNYIKNSLSRLIDKDKMGELFKCLSFRVI